MKIRRIFTIAALLAAIINCASCDSKPVDAIHTTSESASLSGASTTTPETKEAVIESETTAEPVANIAVRRFELYGKYPLDAVYTYVDDGERHPAVLIIPGSGPCDSDGSLGTLKPYRDIARGLASDGVNSLRVEKRTFRYAQSFTQEDGIEQEYLYDMAAALSYLREQPQSGEIYLLGHSLGGQVAADLAARDGNITGVIAFNSSARHLADIAADQFCAANPEKSAEYRRYAATAKSADRGNCRGYYYFGATDYWWASYNQLDVEQSLKKAAVPVLIINSTFDFQSFEADIELWQQHFGADPLVKIQVWDDISHVGYKIDLRTADATDKKTEFPDELISEFSAFCK